MTVSVFDGCGGGCGWIAAICAVASWGSFGVPLKTSVNVEVNFFVMQSYKTLVCFLTCWFVLLLGEEIRWSPWGIASGLFWVPGAACGIYGIRNAGLAIAQGTWSSITVLTSFVFGLIIFEEKVKSFTRTCIALCILISGLIGMSRYAGAGQSSSSGNATSGNSLTERLLDSNGSTGSNGSGSSNAITLPHTSSSSSSFRKSVTTSGSDSMTQMVPLVPLEMEPHSGMVSSSGSSAPGVGGSTTVALSPAPSNNIHRSNNSALNNSHVVHFDAEDLVLFADDKSPSHKDYVVLFGGRLALTRRQMGILGAVINGCWGGCNLIPLHYAHLSGASYLISYASGALIVNTGMWILLFFYQYFRKGRDFTDALDALPKWHLDQLLVPGFLAGLLYSIGNFSSILAVTYLGQSTGFSFCQMQLFVSGLWGVFYFKEIQGREIVFKWFLSAVVAVIGIVWLSYEHEGGSVGH